MASTLRNLISAGQISDRRLSCHQRLEERDCAVAGKILSTIQFQHIHDNLDHDFEIDFWTLAKYSFCRSCFATVPDQLESYRQELHKCLTHEMWAVIKPDSRFASGSDSQNCRARRTCSPMMLEELARQIKQMERDTDGFKQEISVLRRELQIERSQHQQLQQQHGQTIAEGTTRIAELSSQNAALLADAIAKSNELMQKIAQLEAHNSCIQEQMQSQLAFKESEIRRMVGTIKELNAGLKQCHGERYRLNLTWTSRLVVDTLETM